MEHKHPVFDTDTHFTIDPITRQIKNASHRKTTLMQFDHNSERFTFECPRYIEAHDMSECNRVEVHYMNIDGNRQNSGVYTVDDFQVMDGDETQVTCSWVISSNATQLAGTLSFLLRFCCVDGDIITYSWNTDMFTAQKISKGIDASGAFETEYVDVIEQWKASVMGYFSSSIAAWKDETSAAIRQESFDHITSLVGYVTPQTFGAKGDGVTDDTEAFKRALGYPCFIPSGTYLISDTLGVAKDLIGYSKGTVTIVPNGCDVVFNVANGVSLTVKNINIVGNGTETAIALENVRNSTLENVRVENCARAVWFVNGCWANTFGGLTVFNCESGFYNENASSTNMSTTVLRDCYFGNCASAFGITGGSLDVFGGWIENCDVVFDVTNKANVLSIGCANTDFEDNDLLLAIGGGGYATNINRFSFRDCPFVDFNYWFAKTTSVNFSLYFDVTGSMIGKPLIDIFTPDSLWCNWGTNLPEYYLKKTSPCCLYKAKTSAYYSETAIPVELIVDGVYAFPEQVYLSSINIPEGTSVVVHGWDGELFTWTLTGSGELKAVTRPCYKLVFSEQPTKDVPIKVPRNANVLFK